MGRVGQSIIRKSIMDERRKPSIIIWTHHRWRTQLSIIRATIIDGLQDVSIKYMARQLSSIIDKALMTTVEGL
jgi:hypothetical protein